MNIDFDNLPEFEMPIQLLTKLLDCTGFGDGTRGFILSYLKQDGEPEVIDLCESGTVEFALERCLEIYLEAKKEQLLFPPLSNGGNPNDEEEDGSGKL